MYAIWVREFKRITRHKGLLFLLCVWPFLYAVIFAAAYSKEVVTKMPVTLMDFDKSQLSRTLSRFVESSRSFEIVETSSSLSEAQDEILSGQRALVLIIPRDFQKDIKKGRQTEVVAWINASNLLVANLNMAELKTIIGTLAAGIKLKVLRKSGKSQTQALALVQGYNVESAKLYNPGLNYMSYLTPGLWATLLYQIFVLMGALSWIPEIDRKRLPELNQYSLPQIFMGKILFYTLIATVILEVFFRGLYPLFNITIQVSVFEALMLSVLFAFSSIALGTLISIMSDSTVGALKAVIVITSPSFIISGYTWPRDAMPVFYRYLGDLMPLTSYLEAFRKLYQEGVSVIYLERPIFILLSLTVLLLMASWMWLPRRLKKWESLK